jgi:hypothetical protein
MIKILYAFLLGTFLIRLFLNIDVFPIVINYIKTILQ